MSVRLSSGTFTSIIIFNYSRGVLNHQTPIPYSRVLKNNLLSNPWMDCQIASLEKPGNL